jgi:hypothetical protein
MNIEKLLKAVSGDLETGEKLLAAVKAAPQGMTDSALMASAGATAAGGLGALVGSAMGRKTKEAGMQARAAAGIDLGRATQVIAGLSTTRFLIWNTSAFLSRPKELLAEIPRDAIESITLEKGTLIGMPMAALRVLLKTEECFDLMVARVHKKYAIALVEAYTA